ncbi:MAG: malectin domain-containing carbohydrate-binding protein [Lentisphaeraceae bacterium]|nr:malectin domain-containing carbohydrate-binding protein [Lentisphaeraceae bacterium]
MKKCLKLSIFAVMSFCLGTVFAQDKSVLFIVGADGTVGFFEGGVNDHKASIYDASTSGGNHGWLELAESLEANGFILKEISEGAGGTPVELDQMNLAQYDLIVFGSNNAVYTNSQVQAFTDYVNAGGGALFISDANFGEYWSDAPNSDQQFIGQFGWTMNQDRGTYGIIEDQFADSEHPILNGVAKFDGEGVSPITLSNSNVPGVTSTIVTRVPSNQQVRRNNSGGTGQGSSSAATVNDASLIVAEVGLGRVAGHFDRNTFFNLNGAGSNINRFDNETYAINLFTWLSEGSGEPVAIAIPGRLEVENFDEGTQNVTYFDSTSGNSGQQYRDTDVDIQVSSEGGYNVGWVKAGEWLEYTVDVSQSGFYDLTARVASAQSSSKTFSIDVDTVDVTGDITFSTGGAGWQSWQDASLEGIWLTAGEHILRLNFKSSSFNVNYIDFVATEELPATMINSGSFSSLGMFTGDVDYTGGNTFTRATTIDLSEAVLPANEGVYKSERWGPFNYSIGSLVPNRLYTVRLHFAEIYFSAANKRQFNVEINGSEVLNNFDIFAEVGKDKAIIKEFEVYATNEGEVKIDFIKGAVNNPKVSGIELIAD